MLYKCYLSLHYYSIIILVITAPAIVVIIFATAVCYLSYDFCVYLCMSSKWCGHSLAFYRWRVFVDRSIVLELLSSIVFYCPCSRYGSNSFVRKFMRFFARKFRISHLFQHIAKSPLTAVLVLVGRACVTMRKRLCRLLVFQYSGLDVERGAAVWYFTSCLKVTKSWNQKINQLICISFMCKGFCCSCISM